MISSFHNHTSWSDGRASAAEMYAAAVAQGVSLFGISDHFCIYPDGTFAEWSLQAAELAAYAQEVTKLAGPAEIRVGLEIDWFPCHGSTLSPLLDAIPLDYRIGAIHHVGGQQFDLSREFWEQKTAEERDETYRQFWALTAEMAESRLFDFVAHPDLLKKLGFLPSDRVRPAMLSALDAIAANHLAIELNTAGFNQPCADAYPSLDILREANRREIPITLSSDAHVPGHITRHFDRGLSQLAAAGYRQIAQFRRRHGSQIELEAFLHSRPSGRQV